MSTRILALAQTSCCCKLFQKAAAIFPPFFPFFFELHSAVQCSGRDVTIVATGATAVAPRFLDTLPPSQPRGADSAHHHRGRS